MKCIHCGAEAEAGARFCPNCGRAMEDEPAPAADAARRCPYCDATVDATATVCPTCGARLEPAATAPSTPASTPPPRPSPVRPVAGASAASSNAPKASPLAVLQTRNGKIGAGLAAAAVVVIAAVVLLGGGGDKKDDAAVIASDPTVAATTPAATATSPAVQPTLPPAPTATPPPAGATSVPSAPGSSGISEVRRFTGHEDYVLSVAFTNDGRRLLSGGLDETILWDIDSGQPVWRQRGASAEHAAITSDGRRIVSSSYLENSVTVMDGDTGKVLRTIKTPDAPESSVITPDGKQALVGINLGFSDGAAILYDLETGAEVSRIENKDSPVQSVAMSADGTRALLVTLGGEARLVELSSGRDLLTLAQPNLALQAGAFAGTTNRAVFVAYDIDKTVLLAWDLTNGQIVQRIELPGGNEFEAMAVAPEGRRVLVGHDEGLLTLWDLDTGKEIARSAIEGPDTENNIYSVAWSADGRLAAYAGTEDLQAVRIIEFK